MDRVKLQFRLRQDIPDPPRNMNKLHKIDMRGQTDTNWAEKHAKWIRYWQRRQSMVLQGNRLKGMQSILRNRWCGIKVILLFF